MNNDTAKKLEAVANEHIAMNGTNKDVTSLRDIFDNQYHVKALFGALVKEYESCKLKS